MYSWLASDSFFACLVLPLFVSFFWFLNCLALTKLLCCYNWRLTLFSFCAYHGLLFCSVQHMTPREGRWRLRQRHYFHAGARISSTSYDPQSKLLAIGYTNGSFGLYDVGRGNAVALQLLEAEDEAVEAALEREGETKESRERRKKAERVGDYGRNDRACVDVQVISVSQKPVCCLFFLSCSAPVRFLKRTRRLDLLCGDYGRRRVDRDRMRRDGTTARLGVEIGDADLETAG